MKPVDAAALDGLFVRDDRFGDSSRCFIWPRRDFSMRIPDEYKRCVAFVGAGYKADPGNDPLSLGGTGFFISVPLRDNLGPSVWFVTARHVVQGAGLNSYLRVNPREGNAINISLGNVKWFLHPTEPNAVDVAIARFERPGGFDMATIPLDMLLPESKFDEEAIGIGDDVFSVGLFAFLYGSRRNVPIVRCGNLAMIPVDLIRAYKMQERMRAYLIESRSIGGLSGSPVFVHQTIGIPLWHKKNGDVIYTRTHGKTYLLGMTQGHWDIDADDINQTKTARDVGVNVGFAALVPAQKIIETFDGPAVMGVLEAEAQDRQREPMVMGDKGANEKEK